MSLAKLVQSGSTYVACKFDQESGLRVRLMARDLERDVVLFRPLTILHRRISNMFYVGMEYIPINCFTC